MNADSVGRGSRWTWPQPWTHPQCWPRDGGTCPRRGGSGPQTVIPVGVGGKGSSVLEALVGSPLRCHPPSSPRERASPPFSNLHEVVRLSVCRGHLHTCAGPNMAPRGPRGRDGCVLGSEDLQTQPLIPSHGHRRPPLGRSCQAWLGNATIPLVWMGPLR